MPGAKRGSQIYLQHDWHANVCRSYAILWVSLGVAALLALLMRLCASSDADAARRARAKQLRRTTPVQAEDAHSNADCCELIAESGAMPRMTQATQ